MEELDIKKEEIVLLCVGRLPPEKNVEGLLCELWKLGRKDVKLLIIGDGPEKGRLVKMSNSLGLGKVVSFLGMRADVERFYSIADIFISPSKYEPFGQVILEAMAAGLPCIAFKKNLPEYEVASEEIIESGVTGFCVNPFSKNELRDRLLYLVDHPDVRKKMGKMGRKACQKRFTWKGHVTRVLELANH
ncbi:MAG: glycosyltransferase family 4 protein [Candidatus Hodarchaeota archaeon]